MIKDPIWYEVAYKVDGVPGEMSVTSDDPEVAAEIVRKQLQAQFGVGTIIGIDSVTEY